MKAYCGFYFHLNMPCRMHAYKGTAVLCVHEIQIYDCFRRSLLRELLTHPMCVGEVWRRIGMEQSFRKIAHSLNASVGTAFVFKIFKDTGDVEPKHREYHDRESSSNYSCNRL